MKQKKLNQKQEEIVSRLKDLFVEATNADIDFIFDTADNTLTAFNNESEGVVCFDDGEKFDWETGEIIYGDFWDCCSNYDTIRIDYNG